MGNQQSKNAGMVAVLVSPERTLLQHSKTGRKLQQFQLSFPDGNALLQQWIEYQARKKDVPNLLRVVSLQEKKANIPCSQACFLKITFQHCQYTLKETNTLHQEKALFILHEALKGYKALVSRRNQFFQVSRGMIGITEEEEVKVWLNEDPTRNQPCYEPNKQSKTKKSDQQSKMVLNVINVVSSSILQKSFSRNFIKFLNSYTNSTYSFDNVIRAIQEYALRSTNNSQQNSAFNPLDDSTVTKVHPGHSQLPRITETKRNYESRVSMERGGIVPINLLTMYGREMTSQRGRKTART